MTLRIEEFVLAWDALSDDSMTPGLRTISVAPAGVCTLMAGRLFPGNEEAMLARFLSVSLPPAEHLPEGLGFSVSRVDPFKDGQTWLALSRKEPGSLGIFTQMVADMVGTMDALSAQGSERVLRAFIARLRAWQEFMRKGQQPMSPEAEIGLVGELSVLGALIREGVPASVAVQGWVGPLDGIQDFEIGTGALEVKSTLSSTGFPAKIGSLEQLDDSVRQPLFIVGVRFSQRESGIGLPGMVSELRRVIVVDGEASRLFSDRLLAAGFQDNHADRYVRCFALEESRVLSVENGFPRLVPGMVPAGIRRANYEIDLDHVDGLEIHLTAALKKLGAL